MYESWAKTVDITMKINTVSDPDQPVAINLSDHSTKRDRTGVAMLQLIQRDQECLRKLLAEYLNDTSPDGESAGFFKTLLCPKTALCYTTRWCCDRHVDTGFHIRKFFKGQFLYQDPVSLDVYYGDTHEEDRKKVVAPPKAKRKRVGRYRPTADREALLGRLFSWRLEASNNDPIAFARPPSFIIDDKDIQTLVKMHPKDITRADELVVKLKETQEWKDEWSMKIFQVVHAYDQELIQHRKAAIEEEKNNRKRAKVNQDFTTFEEESQKTAARIRQEVLERFNSSRTVLQPISPYPYNIQQRTK